MDVVRKSHFELAETTTTNHPIEEGLIKLTEDVRLLCDWAIKRHQLDMYFKFVDENLLITEDQGSTFQIYEPELFDEFHKRPSFGTIPKVHIMFPPITFCVVLLVFLI